METEFERILTKSSKARILAYMDRNPGSFEEALGLVLSDKQPYAWRAAWVVESLMEDNDPRLCKHVNKFIALLPGKSGGQQRELLKLIFRMKIPPSLEGYLFDLCIRLWKDVKKLSSVRIYALYMLRRIASQHKGLEREVLALVQPPYLDALTPAIRQSAARVAKDKFMLPAKRIQKR